MARTTETNHNGSLHSLLHSLDPISLILSQNSSHNKIIPLIPTTETFHTLERGPRYKAYADLRESKLKFKFYRHQNQIEEDGFRLTPVKKQLRIQESTFVVPKRNKSFSSSVLTQSVPDFSVTLRKENRKPSSNLLSPVMELTPPMKRNNNNNGVLSGFLGGKSASASSAREKQGVLMARKSYANVEELKGLATSVNNAIKGVAAENRGGRGGLRSGTRAAAGRSKTVLGYSRQF